MPDLEGSVRALADALETLERRLDARLHEFAEQEEATRFLERQTRNAHHFAAGAAEDLALIIADLRALIALTD